MGVYAETNLEIECQDNKSAKKVAQKIKQLHKDNKDDMNYDFSKLTVEKNSVYLFKNSGRIQNLEYQIETLWDSIKTIKGILRLNAPFMSEADGMYFEADEEECDDSGLSFAGKINHKKTL